MRRVLNENVRMVMEELQGQTAQPQQQAMPTPGGKPVQPAVKPVTKPGQPAQQVAAGVQATANQAAQTAAGGVDQKLQAQIAQQQGIDPAHAAQVAKTANAQPQPAKVNPTALARDRRNDNMVNRQQAQGGKSIAADEAFAELDTVLAEDEVTEKPAAPGAASPDDKPDLNDNPAAARAKERAKEIDTPSADEKLKDFPGKKVEPKAAGYGKDGAGRPQNHHEVTHPGQRVARHSEKDEGSKTDEAIAETVYTEAERTSVLDGIFGK